MNNEEKSKRIQEIYDEITRLTEELAGLECTHNDCEGCPFKERNQALDCGGFIDLFMYK